MCPLWRLYQPAPRFGDVLKGWLTQTWLWLPKPVPYPESILSDTMAIGLRAIRPFPGALTHKAALEVSL